MTYSLTWLGDCLRTAGLRVMEEPGWQSRGRADMGGVKGVICHHTASNANAGNTAALATVRDGRADLPGPLSQLLLARDGTFHIIAAGRCNHAGKGYWQGVSDGNGHFIGIEAENDGIKEKWGQQQMAAYARGVAAILNHIGADSVMCAGHKEYALPKGRKPDPSFDMIAFRQSVDNIMHGQGAVSVPTVDPKRSMLRKGDMGESVKLLQKALGIAADGDFGPATDRAVKAFQSSKGLVADGLVGPSTWAKIL